MPGLDTLNPASPEANAIANLFAGTLLVMAAIFVIVAALITIAIVRYRARPDSPEPAQDFGSLRLELLWTIGPVIIVVLLFGFTVHAMRTSDPPTDGQEPGLRVTGHQWWWEVDYLQSGVATANEIHIPAGTPMLVELQSADVIHDFWVPRLARKIDVVPGRANRIWLRAGQPGVYEGACAEFCGAQHAWMRFLVVAHPPAEFAEWQAMMLRVPTVPASGIAGRGAKIFRDQACVSCHTIVGTPGNQRIGPDLTHLATRRIIAGGAAENTPRNLARWLADPNSIKPASHMPNFQFDKSDVAALVAYMETLK
ncbi:MAG: cytochrome c oxidase subunit II [Candidatus Binataceae bacterium]